MYLNLQQLSDSLEKRSDSIYAKSFDGERYISMSYAQLYKGVRSIASYFQCHKNFKKGDKIALISENRPEWMMAYLGIVYNGMVAVPFDAMLSNDELKNLIKNSGVETIILSIGLFDKIKQDHDIMNLIKEWIIFDKISQENNEHIMFLEDILHLPIPSDMTKTDIHHHDLASLIFTSGTTGASKAVMLSHSNFAHQINNLWIAAELSEKEVILSVLPLHHTFQFSVELTNLAVGGSMSYADSIKPNRLIDVIKSTHVTLMIGIPTLYTKILDGIMRQLRQLTPPVRQIINVLYHLSAFIHTLTGSHKFGEKVFGFLRKKAGFATVRFLISGAAPLSYNTSKGYAALGFNLANGYGLTESSPVISVGNPSGFIDNKSVGNIIPNVQCKILDPNEQGIGEIAVKGENIMLGYWNNPVATEAVLSADGWLKTGDMGCLVHKKGRDFLYITGRYKNIIVTGGGKNVYPEEIEELLNAHPYILESIVIGVPVSETDKSEIVCALVVVDKLNIEAASMNPDDLSIKIAIDEHIRTINKKLQIYQMIRGYEIYTEELIKNSTRKIKRFEYKGKDYHYLIKNNDKESR
ncbi:MAG: AMP-dependent synthetase/ligase [Brevinema sp.]